LMTREADERRSGWVAKGEGLAGVMMVGGMPMRASGCVLWVGVC
jgi:hypothetical protein